MMRSGRPARRCFSSTSSTILCGRLSLMGTSRPEILSLILTAVTAQYSKSCAKRSICHAPGSERVSAYDGSQTIVHGIMHTRPSTGETASVLSPDAPRPLTGSYSASRASLRRLFSARTSFNGISFRRMAQCIAGVRPDLDTSLLSGVCSAEAGLQPE